MRHLLLGTLALVLLLGAAGCGQTKYCHAVFFTLHEDTPDEEVDALILDGYRMLGRIHTVRQVESGRRDPNAKRDVNNQAYDVGLMVYFDDRAGHDVYNDHPIHKEYIEKHKEHWANVQVFDFVAPKKMAVWQGKTK